MRADSPGHWFASCSLAHATAALARTYLTAQGIEIVLTPSLDEAEVEMVK